MGKQMINNNMKKITKYIVLGLLCMTSGMAGARQFGDIYDDDVRRDDKAVYDIGLEIRQLGKRLEGSMVSVVNFTPNVITKVEIYLKGSYVGFYNILGDGVVLNGSDMTTVELPCNNSHYAVRIWFAGCQTPMRINDIFVTPSQRWCFKGDGRSIRMFVQ